MKRFLHNVAEFFRSLGKDVEHPHEIVLNQDSVCVKWINGRNETESASFQWRDVLMVDTFKRDYLTVDCICLAFETPDGWIEVNEDMKGWPEFLQAVEPNLPGFPSQEKWWHEVMIPVFEINHSTLWKRVEHLLSHLLSPPFYPLTDAP
ncbi:MAG: hypothetical protein JXB62_04425 [Pirellulales bacterium]|nr:hypothetical protein [Pirellulales bacterium]